VAAVILKETLTVNKPAQATDAYDGGVKVIRDAMNAKGGTHGHVNCGLYAYTVSGEDIKAFEWNALFKLDNHSTHGENCAFYAQANKHGRGPTWGGCIEATDTTPGDDTGLVGLEVDCSVSGPDNGLRYGIDVVLFDSRTMRGMSPSDVCEGTAGIRVNAQKAESSPKWVEGMCFEGGMDRCIDTTRSDARVAIKLAKGQVIQIGGTTIGKRNDLALWFAGAALAASLAGLWL
jgi:hypothetical protein